MNYPYPIPANDPRRKGYIAGRKLLFGSHNRFAVAPVHTRFGALTWFVWDAGLPHDADTGLPPIIRQADTFEEAVADLPLDQSFPAPTGIVFTHQEPRGAAQ